MTIDSGWAERYSRQIMLAGIGGNGQRRLGEARVGIIGSGPAARTVLLYMVAAGVGVARGETAPIAGMPEVAHALASNPACRIEPLRLPEDAAHLDLLIDTGESAIDGNRIALQWQLPLLGAMPTEDGRIRLAGSRAGANPNLPCMACGAPPRQTQPAQWNTLALPATGCALASEAIKTLLAIGDPTLFTAALLFDPLRAEYQTLPRTRDPACPCCATEFIDITIATCPMTFVLVKLKMETMAPGQRLRVRLNGGEPLTNLPLTLRDEGWPVSPPWTEGDAFGLLVTKLAR
ncbi:MAG: sulfurtransferase TusA family protein [Magnetococcales bacterium]|nr:sulfurtransferase TusA family protein [Magnetococcales bacterium]